VKLLFDHNLSPQLITLLADLHPNSNHVFPLQLDKEDDRVIWNYAKENGYIIVTKDTDFSDLSLLLGHPPKVIWIRRGNCKTKDIETLLRQHHINIENLEKDTISGVLALL
jgi:predicted nuclease of predicted toxin-antitoxin system